MFSSCIPCAEPENSFRGVSTPDFLDQRTSPSQRAVCTSLLLEGVSVSLLLLEGSLQENLKPLVILQDRVCVHPAPTPPLDLESYRHTKSILKRLVLSYVELVHLYVQKANITFLVFCIYNINVYKQ